MCQKWYVCRQRSSGSRPILLGRFIGVRSPAGEVGLKHLLGTIRHTSKFQPDPSILVGQHGVFGPWVGLKVSLGLIVAERKSHAARVEEQRIVQSPDLLEVC